MTWGFYILHEGLIGVVGEDGLQEITIRRTLPSDAPPRPASRRTSGWLGITDKYWAAVVIPDQKPPLEANFTAERKTADRAASRPTI